MLRFKSVLSVLSKSSPYAVRTLHQNDDSIEDRIKDYLFITTDIERAFKEALINATEDDIIFLCGSSGDGKSEILTRYCEMSMFKGRYVFHLDATHSFSPTANAIQTLDELFEQNRGSDKTLVVGINVGMLGNYAQEGAEQHNDIKSSIKNFLEGSTHQANHQFLDFEQFPKFVLGQQGYTAEFVKSLFQKLTAPSNNIIRDHYDHEKTLLKATDKQLCANYELLSDEAVQDSVIELLFKARLVKDQFLTARALLDFIFHLLAGPAYLFDNLFTGSDNELASKIVNFDPANIRTQHIDKFILSRSLGLPDHDFEVFVEALSLKGFTTSLQPESYLRLFYLLKNAEFGNNYHQSFSDDFQQQLIKKYTEIWHLHCHFDGSDEHKLALRKYYKDVAIAAIHKYNNRNAPKLGKGEFFISEHNGFQLAADLELKAHVTQIAEDEEIKTSHFNTYFKVGKRVVKLPTNINLLSLMLRIVEGYRPNKHDKNTVVLLDELVEQITEVANGSDTLHILNTNGRYKITNDDFDEFEVSGL
ncbi:DNA phosphorothioation-dependent restriction protein DptF [Shewanella sp.]|uniref:DNA phosphorothioation-dependent restriction protein DptF n=1 Tax=Shewanella sp. TaxID=50422 RepID=UPI001EC0ABC7|nr:DNA phosphorothioation-dependent restriction protein DptF [Shewanella sp.]NRB24568.1 DNA phosphorothioation-dependent restriction protein DptF [Shewanella sp.]